MQKFDNKILLGNAIMIAALVTYVISDAVCKGFMSYYTAPQVCFFRTIARIIPLIIACIFMRKNPLTTSKLKYHLYRGIVASASTVFLMGAYKYSHMTDVHAIGYTSAFFVLIFSYLLLGEKIRERCIIAVIIGLIGTLVIIRPDFKDGLNIGGIFALCTAILSGLNSVMIRKLTETEHTLTIIMYHNIILLVLSGILSINAWNDIENVKILLTGFAFVGIISAICQSAIAYAFSMAKSSDLAVSGYVTIIPIVLIDVLYWETIPDISVILGVVLIVIGNYIVVRRHD